MFANSAYAAPATQGMDLLGAVLPFALVFAVVYFFMLRPQQKRAAAHKQALSAMKRGDRVVTSSGVVATISKVKESEFVLEIAEDVQILVVKDAVAALYSSSSDGARTERSEGTETTTKGRSKATKSKK